MNKNVFLNSSTWVFEPLKICFSLATPMLLTYPFMPLDSLVIHLMAKTILGASFYQMPSNKILRGKDLFSIKYKVPLSQHSSGMYYASFSHFEEDIQKLATLHYIRRRFHDSSDTSLLFSKTKKIPMNRGTLKSCNIRNIQVHPKSVIFYCHGVRQVLLPLLSEASGLGKKTNTGNGMISKIEIVSIKQDYSFCKNGFATRPIPIRFLELYLHKALMTWIPPYWARDMLEYCAVPGSRIILKQEIFNAQ